MLRARLSPNQGEAGAGSDRAIVIEPLVIDSPACAASSGMVPVGGGGGGGGGTPNGNVIPPPTPYTGPAIPTADSERCDFLDTSVCLHPWPNDYFTVEDASTDNGRRVNLNLLSLPANAPGGLGQEAKPIDAAEQNRNDGFSPGNLIVTRVPGLDNRRPSPTPARSRSMTPAPTTTPLSRSW